MLVKIGKSERSTDVVDLLHECHGRIRRFLVMARHLAEAADVSATIAALAAGEIRRYFVEAFPLHLADEELDIAPRCAAAGNAVTQMLADHAFHAAAIDQLVRICADLERDPDLARHRSRLTAAVEALAVHLEAHLELEERVVFPVLRQLPRLDQDRMRDSMRARRLAIARPHGSFAPAAP